jgi:hypothetical protein
MVIDPLGDQPARLTYRSFRMMYSVESRAGTERANVIDTEQTLLPVGGYNRALAGPSDKT